MPRPVYTLYTPEASFRAFPILIAAEYNDVSVTVNTATTANAATLSPVHKLPLLQVDATSASLYSNQAATIFSSAAATRYIANLRTDTGLTGSSSNSASSTEAATIDAWMDWCQTDVELPACLWFYPVAGYMAFNPTVYVFIMYYLFLQFDVFLKSMPVF